MKSSYKIYSFLRAVRGNWRNAIFVSCDCGNCMCGRATPCSGFLLAVDECGQVMLLSAEDIQRLSGETVDSSECIAILSRRALTPPFPSTSNGTHRSLPPVRSDNFLWTRATINTVFSH